MCASCRAAAIFIFTEIPDKAGRNYTSTEKETLTVVLGCPVLSKGKVWASECGNGREVCCNNSTRLSIRVLDRQRPCIPKGLVQLVLALGHKETGLPELLVVDTQHGNRRAIPWIVTTLLGIVIGLSLP